MRKPLPYTLLPLLALLMTAVSCSYDENLDVCQVSVQLIYPDNSISAYEGAHVEMKSAKSSVFISTTDASGRARFTLPPGIYEATSNDQYVDSTSSTWWRYIFNGVRSLIVVSPDSTNQVALELKMSKKRIVH